MEAIIVILQFHRHLYFRTGLWILSGRSRHNNNDDCGSRPNLAVLGNRSKQFFHTVVSATLLRIMPGAHHPTSFRPYRFKTMAHCNSKVFFPDDPTQPPQFNGCPRRSETTRRTVHSVMRLCSTCAKVWDEQDVPLQRWPALWCSSAAAEIPIRRSSSE
jgi:hypothetical protein